MKNSKEKNGDDKIKFEMTAKIAIAIHLKGVDEDREGTVAKSPKSKEKNCKRF